MLGATYKKCRKNKNKTQKEACKNIIERSTLSKFENNEINLSISNFIGILNNIDLSLEEFMCVYNNYKISNRDNIIDLFFSIPNNSSKEEYEQIIKMCNKYESKEDNIINEIGIISQLMIDLKNIHDFSQGNQINKLRKKANIIWNRLKNQEDWYIDDLRLLNHILYLFEDEQGIFIGKEILKKLERYKKYKKADILYIAVLLNVSYMYILKGKNEDAILLLDKALRLSNKQKRVDLIAICYVRIGVIQNDKEKVDKGLLLLSIVEEDSLLKSLKEEIYFDYPFYSK